MLFKACTVHPANFHQDAMIIPKGQKRAKIHTFVRQYHASNSILKQLITAYSFQHTFWRQALSPTGRLSLSQALAVEFYSTDPQLTSQ